MCIRDRAYATIVWSSTYYDYMLVDGKKYTNENEGGNSTFTFPIAGVPCTMDVVGDTTAMSQPHEIDYTLTFSFAKDVSFKDLKQTGQVKLSYADQFQIDEYGNYKLITIVDNGRFLPVSYTHLDVYKRQFKYVPDSFLPVTI